MSKHLLRWLIIPGIILFSPSPVLPFLYNAFGIKLFPDNSPLTLLLIPVILAGYGLTIGAFIVALIQSIRQHQNFWISALIIAGVVGFFSGILAFFNSLFLFIGPLIILIYSLNPQSLATHPPK